MTDIEKAKNLLVQENTCVLVKGDKILVSTKRGISPMMEFIGKGENLQGFSVADRIVGKAAAMLFALAKISCVHASVLSSAALNFLKAQKIKTTYNLLVEKIVNRAGTGICPMEETVQNETDCAVAYAKLKEKIEQMKKS